jgi:D-glycero-beta-D-manno-heptose-7-phosphate kinase
MDNHFADLRQRIEGLRVLVAGDVMIDRYLLGQVSRISPEAPVPILELKDSYDRPGGAANVALNIVSMGATCHCFSMTGDDRDGSVLGTKLRESGVVTHFVVDGLRPTTVKTRLIAHGQQVYRVDSESKEYLSGTQEDHIIERWEELALAENYDLIIFQDYNKGFLTPRLIETMIATAQKQGIVTAVDPKKEHFFAYKGATLFKPNLKELRDALQQPVKPETADLLDATSVLRQKLEQSITLITLSEKGIFVEKQGKHALIPTEARHVVDVSGAGDTVIAVAALAVAAGATPAEAAHLGNIAAGQVCGQSGVVPVNAKLFWELIGRIEL